MTDIYLHIVVRIAAGATDAQQQEEFEAAAAADTSDIHIPVACVGASASARAGLLLATADGGRTGAFPDNP